uniref:Bacterial Pleckstrin homology domain-containing protein n=1 Tax=Eubacterium cellulosolvens (strain ATCC 43171 / JCM 9499 / 6) TaxID=633697 RepID=I5AUC5_EUBC6
MDTNAITWIFNYKCAPNPEILSILVPGEQILSCYATVRDQAALTTHRIIVMDKQGLTGKKVEIYSLPYRSIDMWSSENAGPFLDFDAELELWTKAGHIKLMLNRRCDIREFDRILGRAILSWK